MTISYVSFDPGGSNKASTGMATWDKDGNCLGKTRLTNKQLTETLISLEPIAEDIKVFIIESYIGYSWMSHHGNKFKTSQQIGALKFFAQRWGIEVVEQGADKKEMGLMFSGKKKTWKGHMPDDWSAYCHGYYYLHLQGIIKPAVLDDPELNK